MVNTCVFILGVVIQATAVSSGANGILAGRFIVGMGVGSISMVSRCFHILTSRTADNPIDCSYVCRRMRTA